MAATVVRIIAIPLAAFARSATGAITWRDTSRTGTARIGTARTGTTRTSGTTGKDAEHRSAVLRGSVTVFMEREGDEAPDLAATSKSLAPRNKSRDRAQATNHCGARRSACPHSHGAVRPRNDDERR